VYEPYTGGAVPRAYDVEALLIQHHLHEFDHIRIIFYIYDALLIFLSHGVTPHLTPGQKKRRWNELFNPAPIWASKRDDLT
jgi:hypothetical protein